MSSGPKVLGIDELHKLTRTPRNGGLQRSCVEDAKTDNELWACLIETVRSPMVSDKHMTAACNALCFVVRTNAQSQDEALNLKAYNHGTWEQMFSAARSAFAAGKNKPALQVLETLHYLAETNPDRVGVVLNVEKAAETMTRVILSHNPRRSLKEACIVLYFFLRKLSDFMSFSDVLNQALNHERTMFVQLCHSSNLPTVVWSDETHPQWFAFVLALLFAVRLTESKSATLKLLALLCGFPNSTYEVDIPSVLSRSIDLYSIADETALEAVTRDVLPSVLTSQPLFANFLQKQQQVGTSSVTAILVVLTLLQFGKSKGYVTESVLPEIIEKYWLGCEISESTSNRYDAFSRLLSHGSASVRLGACELLLSSTSPNSPFPSGVLSCIVANLRFLHDDTDAFHRGELFSILRRFLTRIQQSHRALQNSKTDDTHRHILHEYGNFYDQYLLFLKRELSASNSYPRHILALQVLDLVFEGPSHQEGTLQEKLVVDPAILVYLFCLVLDPYEDVRAHAAEIIARIARREPRCFQNTILMLDSSTIVSRLAATTNRADHADALGRVLSLIPTSHSTTGQAGSMVEDLSQLSDRLGSHISSLSAFDVSTDFPLHGVVLGIKYVIENSGKSITAPPVSCIATLLDICGKIWVLSQSHLCIDSPEMESEPTESSDSGPKDRLAYAWRALRDSNLMMQAMLQNLVCDFALLQSIGDTCLNQLALLRHRGAFSTVAQTFVLCCQKARDSVEVDSQALTDRWFSEAMKELEMQADKLTRRSAGLPAMFAAILDPVEKSKFSRHFQQLVAKAVERVAVKESIDTEEKLRLPQVHALNCIKEVMTSSRFRVLTEPLVVFTLNLAASCMSSNIWAIKNCGLMLLRASINRLDPDTGLGLSEAGMKQRALSETERRPVDVAVDFLNTSLSRSIFNKATVQPNDVANLGESTEAVFAGLDILSRLYIAANEPRSISPLVADHLKHPLWHIRAQAARLLAHLTPHGTELIHLQEHLRNDYLATELDFNKTHGILMLSECIIQKLQVTSVESTYAAELVSILHQILQSRAVASHSGCMAKWLSVADQFLEKTQMGIEVLHDLLDASEQIVTQPRFSISRVDALYNRHLAVFTLRCYTRFGNMYAPMISLLRTCEDDIFTYSLTAFHPDLNLKSMMRYLEVLTSLVQGTGSEEKRAAVMQAVIANLAQAKSQMDATQLAVFVELLDFDNPVSRDLSNTQLAFFAILCRLAWTQSNTSALDSLVKFTGGFCLHLRAAADDEIEYDTRYSTIKALQLWKAIPDIGRMLNYLMQPRYQMDVFSVLYDLLNDDDEDIRAEASEFTVTLTCEFNGTTPVPTRSLCPAASRRHFRSYLFREFGSTQLLRDECLRRVLGKKMTTSRLRLQSANDKYLCHAGIDSDLRPIFEAMRELFAEEKQNLYVDEIAEIEVWSALLSRTSFSQDSRTVDRLSAWSQNGAEQLTTIFEGKHPWSSSLFDIGADAHFGIPDTDLALRSQPKVVFGTSLTESLELLITRVVVGLRLSSKGESITLELLQKNCVRLNMSQAVLSAFTWSLG